MSPSAPLVSRQARRPQHADAPPVRTAVQDLLALKQHSQRFSNASTAVDVVIPGAAHTHAHARTYTRAYACTCTEEFEARRAPVRRCWPCKQQKKCFAPR